MHFARTVPLLLATLLLPPAAAADERSLVLTHWTSPGETAALAEIRNSVERRGGPWSLVTYPTSVALRKDFVAHLADGTPPLALQWYLDGETKHFVELGSFRPIDDVVPTETWADVLPPFVLDRISHRGVVHFAPIGLHIENWLWVNRAVLSAHGLDLPRTWRDLVSTSRILKERGIEPLIVTDDEWVRALLIRAVLADVVTRAPKQNERLLWAELVENPRLEDAVRTLVDLKPLLNRSAAERTWSDGVADLAHGRAAFYVMGDWLKGELSYLGQSVGGDIDCLRPPGNDWLVTVAIDAFAFPVVAGADGRQAQATIVEAVMDPSVQVSFAMLKGALPPRLDADTTGLDRCARLALAELGRSTVSTYQLEPHSDAPSGSLPYWVALDDALWRPGVTVEHTMVNLRRIALEGH